VADIFMAYPFMLLTISIIAVLGSSLFNLILVLGISDWVTYARTIRGSVLSLKEKEFVESSRAIGTSHPVIIVRHILPNVISPTVVQAAICMSYAILIEAALSYLGLGIQPPTPSWGTMLNEGRTYLEIAPWISIFPGLAIMLAVLAFNLMSDGFRDALDPRRTTQMA